MWPGRVGEAVIMDGCSLGAAAPALAPAMGVWAANTLAPLIGLNSASTMLFEEMVND